MGLKMTTYFLQMSGYTVWLWGIFDDFGDFKSMVLFIVGLIFAGLRIWSTIIDVKKNSLITRNIKRLKKAA